MKENMSKADILMELKPRLKSSYIEDIHVFTVEDWGKRRKELLELLVSYFSPLPVVVRSSSQNEDTEEYSQAGCFHSEIGVNSTNSGELSAAIEKVIISYNDKDMVSMNDQIIVQTQTQSVDTSGVVFTRTLGTNFPYYVINYDDASSKTNTVTGGIASSMVCIFRELPVSSAGRWRKLLEAIKEIEGHFPDFPLDIEFAQTTDSNIVVFQARPLSANIGVNKPDKKQVNILIESMKTKFLRVSRPVPHLGGKRTIFGDMPDWNPAEMIGNRPNTLDYSLYSFLITDSVWHEARSTLGYKDVYPGELMISFGKRPYIDTRVSFNSFVPKDVSEELCNKLVNYYLEELEKHPEKQDKIEFEIVWSCFTFSLDNQLANLTKKGFSNEEISELKTSLLNFTNTIIEDANSLFKRDVELVSYLTERKKKILSHRDPDDLSPWTLFNIAYNLLQNCKKFGILPFSRLARMAFIGKSILISLKDEKIISNTTYHNFLNSIQTVASVFSKDLRKFQTGEKTKKEFFDSYGHLRPGTYDITALRYCDMYKNIFEQNNPHHKDSGSHEKECKISQEEMSAIDNILRKNKLSGNSKTLLDFIARAIEYREVAKLEFTRTLSEALEFISLAGKKLGFSRDDLSQVDLTTLMKFRNPEYSDIEYSQDVLKQSLERHRKEREWSDFLVLPPVIINEKDFEIISFYKARPNFITEKMVQGPVLKYDRDKFFKIDDMSRFIIFLESADPGYDWIFARNPMGIVTKYGGVASHMAIRCAEFGIPAAIGCGSTIYNNLVKSNFVVIDGAKQALEHLEG
jgi:phosphohistidine swiveling domain-containing protein